MDLRSITPVILTWNEEPNIGRTLAALAWAEDIVVVDSLSTDRTAQICRDHPHVRVVERAFDAHAAQWNFATRECAVRTDWILALDADYVVSAELVRELESLEDGADVAAYEARFVYCVAGQPLRSGVYPPVTVLFRRGRGAYAQDGHTQRLAVDGRSARLRAPILHDDRKPLARWLASQARYMALEAEKLATAPAGSLGPADRLRKLVVPAPFLMFFYAYFVKGAILDGRPGLYYALQRAAAEAILSLSLLHRKLFR